MSLLNHFIKKRKVTIDNQNIIHTDDDHGDEMNNNDDGGVEINDETFNKTNENENNEIDEDWEDGDEDDDFDTDDFHQYEASNRKMVVLNPDEYLMLKKMRSRSHRERKIQKLKMNAKHKKLEL